MTDGTVAAFSCLLLFFVPNYKSLPGGQWIARIRSPFRQSGDTESLSASSPLAAHDQSACRDEDPPVPTPPLQPDEAKGTSH